MGEDDGTACRGAKLIADILGRREVRRILARLGDADEVVAGRFEQCAVELIGARLRGNNGCTRSVYCALVFVVSS